MITRKIASALRRIALAASLAACSSLASAAVMHVDVDTSSFGVASGYLDLQLSTNGGPLTTALVNNMVGFDPSAYIDAVGVTQTAAGYLFRSDTFGDLFHAVHFGGVLSFDVDFQGLVDPTGQYPSLFLVSAFDDNFGLLGNADPVRGALAALTWTAPAANGLDGSVLISIADPAVTVIPEPGGMLLSGIGLAAAAFVLRRRAKRVTPPPAGNPALGLAA